MKLLLGGMMRRLVILTSLILFSSFQRGYADFVPVEDATLKPLTANLQAPNGLYPATVGLSLTVKERHFITSDGRPSPSDYFCSGTLIAPDWVLTMANCVDKDNIDTDPTEIKIRYGDTIISKTQSSDVKRVISHPQYNKNTFENNIALIQLKSPIPIRPIRIIGDDGQPVNLEKFTFGEVVGWGSLCERACVLDELEMRLSVSLVPIETCRSSKMYGDRVRPDMICAQSVFEKVDVCAGFGGAPLMVPDASGRPALLGLVNWGEGCARKDRPTVYTNVTKFISWITSVTGPLPQSKEEAIKFSTRTLQDGATLRLDANIAAPEPSMTFQTYRFITSIEKKKLPPADGHICGGVLINRHWVLTAAHCVWGYKDHPDELKFRFDCDYLTDSRAQRATAKRIITHENFAKTAFDTFLYDIALIELNEDTPGDIVYPKMVDSRLENIVIHQKNYDPQIIGWGKNAFSRLAAPTNYLHRTTVPIVPNSQCNRPESYAGLVNDFELCAGSEGQDACQGDSGGPLVVWDDDQGYLLLGLVSWGEGCGANNKPGVYVRLSALKDWIERNTKSAEQGGSNHETLQSVR